MDNMSYHQTTSFNSDILYDMHSYSMLQDRLPGDQLSLPRALDDIKIKANDIVISDTINMALENIHENWLYLLSNSVIPTNDIPNSDYSTHMIVDRGAGVEWVDQTKYNESIPNGDIEHIKNIIKIQNTINPNNFNLIATTQTNVILLSGFGTESIDVILNPDGLGQPIYSDSSITHPSNGIFFENIIDVAISDSNDLFVLDGNHKTIFKFDISGITTLDEAILKNDTPGRLLTDMVGGIGSVTDKTKFQNPITQTTKNNIIYVIDQVGSDIIVKSFDLFLSWIESFNLSNITSSTVVDFNYNPGIDRFYILLHDIGSIPKLMVLESNFDVVGIYDMIDIIKHDVNILTEVHKRIYFSIENPNIMYVLTEKNIYKKYVSRPTSFIGRFKFDDSVRGAIGPLDEFRSLNDMSMFVQVVTSVDGVHLKDEIYVSEQYKDGIYRFLEDSGFENSLESRIDEKVLSFRDVKIKSEENIDSLVYNKSIYKSLFNNLLLLENTSRKFSTVYDSRGFSIYIGFKYLNNDELKLLDYNLSADNYISSNETVTTFTVNRCLERIYNLQVTILGNMQEKSINVYPLIDTPIILD